MSSTNLTNPVLDKVLGLTFSDDSIIEFFSLANRAYLAIYMNGGKEKMEYLAKIKKVIETQIRPLLEEELTLKEKQALFNTAKTNLATLLKGYSKNTKS
jgi:hypothetical protein